MTDESAAAAWLRTHLAEFLDVPEAGIDPSTPFAELGLSSMEAVVLTGDIQTRYGVPLEHADLRTHSTIGLLAAHIAVSRPDSDPGSASASARGGFSSLLGAIAPDAHS